MSKSGSTSKADTAVKLVMIFFISLLSFSVGTYVGKQVSDGDYRRAALESDYNGGDKVATANDEEATADNAATKPISDEDVSNLTDEFVKSEQRKVASEDAAKPVAEHPAEEHHAEAAEHHEEHAPASEHAAVAAKTEDGYTHRSKAKAEMHEAVVAMNDKKVTAPEHAVAEAAPVAKAAPVKVAIAEKAEPKADVSKAADRVAHDLAPAADPKKVTPPSTILPTVATTAVGKYTVQVASYATEAEAKEQSAKLTGKGYSAFFIPATVNGKTWYRVSVGLFSDQKSATNYRTELLATQAVTTAIVQKIVK